MSGQSRQPRGDDEVGVIVNTVIRRGCSQKDVRVRRQGRRGVGESPGENDAARSEAIDIRCQRMVRIINAQSVGANRIDGDEKHVQPGLALLGTGGEADRYGAQRKKD
jgi:hypothetical protein